MNNPVDIANRIVSVCHRLYEHGFVTAMDGNVSARLPNGNFLVTPSSLNKGNVTEDDLIEVTMTGESVIGNRKVSTELGMHLFIYAQRSDVHAVVHAHPTYASGFAVARRTLPENILPEVIVSLGTIPLAQYGTPSTKELAESLRPFVKTASAILLANHGVVTYGSDVDDAYFKMEKVEHVAHIAFVARMLGGERQISAVDKEKLKKLSGSTYGKNV
ncbi:MAG: class II aldolase/adducin family protein [Ignavibacteriales bacterium]|nr:class II aldolase/adducin family protein [Ignavibacteriales bacterium]